MSISRRELAPIVNDGAPIVIAQAVLGGGGARIEDDCMTPTLTDCACPTETVEAAPVLKTSDVPGKTEIIVKA